MFTNQHALAYKIYITAKCNTLNISELREYL